MLPWKRAVVDCAVHVKVTRREWLVVQCIHACEVTHDAGHIYFMHLYTPMYTPIHPALSRRSPANFREIEHMFGIRHLDAMPLPGVVNFAASASWP